MKRQYLAIFLLFSITYGVTLYLKLPGVGILIKPVPLLVLIFLTRPVSAYNRSILTGFILSLLGDIFLAKYINQFIPGLVSFLAAHIFYIRAFYHKSGKPAIKESSFFYAYGILIFLFLRIYLGEMLVPVLIYIFVIVTMVWRAYVQRNVTERAAYAFYGSVLFCLSDTLLALNLFYSQFALSGYAIMATYWSAQFLIYKSIDI